MQLQIASLINYDQNWEKTINIWPHLKFFFAFPRLCWAGYGPGLVTRKF